MNIRLATDADVAKLAVLGAATFSDTFGHLYSPEDLAFFVNNSHSEASYAAALADEKQPIWVADDEGLLAAYIKLCPDSLPCDPPIENAAEIARLYARSSHQNQGLGSRLMDTATTYAKSAGYSAFVLSVWSENYDGHRFYARHGFKKIGDYLFPVGDQLDKEWIMHKKL